jgi:membrane-bound acyltransferase YfiQ involved in biofilm formation
MESLYITFKNNIVSKDGNNILFMNNNISYQISLMTLVILLILFEYNNIIRGTFIVTLNMI